MASSHVPKERLRQPLTMPDHIWYLIARFMPSDELRRLYGVNKALFHISMEERYRSVCFCRSDKKMKWLCKNITAPLVQQYVRRVEIKPWQIEYRAITQPPRGSIGSLRQAFACFVGGSDDWLPVNAEEAYARRKLTKAVSKITKAVKDLPNVHEYKVQCKEGTCDAFFVNGLIPALMRWTRTLTKLTLCVPPGELLRLPEVRLDHLESLDLMFWTPADDQNYFRFMVLDPLAVFVNNLYPTLQSLSVAATRCAVNVDLTPLFRSLGTFPHMRNFELSMPYDGSSLSCIEPLLSFLARHKGIHSFRLSTSSAAPRHAPTSVELREWIPNVLRFLDGSFGNIEDANLALRPLKAKSTLTALMGFLSAHDSDLTSLTLTEDKTLNIQEIQCMFRSKDQYDFFHLQHLSLHVLRISAELFSFLAKTFRNLKNLEIGILYYPRGPEFDIFCEELMEHWQDFLGWHLKTISIPGRAFPGQERLRSVLIHSMTSLEDVQFLTNNPTC
ncbi:hypothetical protein APHAL10511_005189 [Amanita phalloides]|nr:hypothetical protein APHAL10511_005189 [Amanita phalloides]